MTGIEFIEQKVKEFNTSIASDMDKKRITDTNKAKRSLKVVVSGNSVKSIGIDYIEYLNRGSAPWKGDDNKNAKILGYILEKNGWSDRRKTNPYAAAYGIVRKGSKIYRNKSKGLELEKKVEVLTKEIIEGLSKVEAENISIRLNEAMKGLA